MKTLASIFTLSFLLILSTYATPIPPVYSGFWVNTLAEENEPYILIIDSQAELVQLVPKGTKEDYRSLPLAKFEPVKYKRKRAFKAAFEQYEILLLPAKDPQRMEVKVKNNGKFLSMKRTYPFIKPKQRQVTEGGITFINRGSRRLNLYYATSEEQLLLQTLDAGERFYQPTQVGMTWVARFEGDFSNAKTVFGTRSYYQQVEVYDPYSNQGSQPGMTAGSDIKSSIWYNPYSNRGELSRIIIGAEGKFAYVNMRGSRGQANDQGTLVVLQMTGPDTYSMQVAGKAYNLTYHPNRLNGLEVKQHADPGARNSRTPTTSMRQLTRSNADGTIEFHNRMNESLKIYCDVGVNPLYFYELPAGATVEQPTQKDMNWIVKGSQNYIQMVQGNSDDQVIYLDRNTQQQASGGTGQPTRGIQLDAPTNIMIANTYNQDVYIYALNSDGQLKPWGMLKNGKVDIYPSFIGQTIVIRAADRRRSELTSFTVERDKQRFGFIGPPVR
ncbi:MAG: hypothetical protein D6730_10945 [Bacteroidetes bacterium]|nr:MAG: hypothetical protein D6730_10945 [Bacteroidota bacterium]